ncbi:MAG: hypothetical protein WC783_02870 [Candidatus Paceibacterota bacterium]|jgi:hypothetical protein
MGTRGIILVCDNIEKNNTPVYGDDTLFIEATMYFQFDTYPTGLGDDIKNALNGGNVQIINGISMNQESPEYFNRIPDLAAYLVYKLKEQHPRIGSVELGNSTRNTYGIEYIYILYPLKVCEESFKEKSDLKLRLIGGYSNKVLYDGLLKDADMQKIEKDESNDND